MGNDRMKNGSVDGNDTDPSTWSSLRRLLGWGVGVKRWLAVGSVGVGILALGLAYLLVKVFSIRPSSQFPAVAEAAVGMVVGTAILALSLYGLYRSIGPVLFERMSFDRLSVGHLIKILMGVVFAIMLKINKYF